MQTKATLLQKHNDTPPYDRQYSSPITSTNGYRVIQQAMANTLASLSPQRDPSCLYTSEEPSLTPRVYEPADIGLVSVPVAFMETGSPRFGELGDIVTERRGVRTRRQRDGSGGGRGVSK